MRDDSSSLYILGRCESLVRNQYRFSVPRAGTRPRSQLRAPLHFFLVDVIHRAGSTCYTHDMQIVVRSCHSDRGTTSSSENKLQIMRPYQIARNLA